VSRRVVKLADMPDDKFETNLSRLIAAELYVLLGLQTSREMFGKSYFALGISEKQVVDQTVFGQVGANYQSLTPEMLAAQTAKPAVGFQSQAVPTPGSEAPRKP
jgi:hypothetical protein